MGRTINCILTPQISMKYSREYEDSGVADMLNKVTHRLQFVYDCYKQKQLVKSDKTINNNN